MTTKQEILRYDVVYRFKETRDQIYAALVKAYESVPLDHILIDTDSAASSVSQGVHREDGRRAHVDLLAYFLARPECWRPLLEVINKACGMRAIPDELTAEQKVSQMSRALADNPGLRTIVEQVTGVQL